MHDCVSRPTYVTLDLAIPCQWVMIFDNEMRVSLQPLRVRVREKERVRGACVGGRLINGAVSLDPTLARIRALVSSHRVSRLVKGNPISRFCAGELVQSFFCLSDKCNSGHTRTASRIPDDTVEQPLCSDTL